MGRRVAWTAVLVVLGAATLVCGEEASEAPEAPNLLGMQEARDLETEQVVAIVASVAEKVRWQVRVDATFLRIDATKVEAILGDHRPDKAGSTVLLPATLGRMLVDRARGRGPVRPEPLPALVLGTGQAGRLSATGHHTYVQDHDAGRSHGFEFTPLVGRLTDGARIDVVPERRAPGIRVRVYAAWAEVVRPIPLFDVSKVPDEEMSRQLRIELPEMRIVEQRGHVDLPAEGGFLLAGQGRTWGGDSLSLVVVEVRPVP